MGSLLASQLVLPSQCLLSVVDFFNRETILVRVSKFPGVTGVGKKRMRKRACMNACGAISATHDFPSSKRNTNCDKSQQDPLWKAMKKEQVVCHRLSQLADFALLCARSGKF